MFGSLCLGRQGRSSRRSTCLTTGAYSRLVTAAAADIKAEAGSWQIHGLQAPPDVLEWTINRINDSEIGGTILLDRRKPWAYHQQKEKVPGVNLPPSWPNPWPVRGFKPGHITRPSSGAAFFCSPGPGQQNNPASTAAALAKQHGVSPAGRSHSASADRRPFYFLWDRSGTK